MGFKLVISDLVEFPVKFTLNDAGKMRQFVFSLIAKRKPVDELREFATRVAQAGDDHEETVRQMLLDTIVGWRGQTLVVEEETGAPAGYTREGMEMVLDLVGVRTLVMTAYFGACSEKGKEKN
jgi:hypothetical protein